MGGLYLLLIIPCFILPVLKRDGGVYVFIYFPRGFIATIFKLDITLSFSWSTLCIDNCNLFFSFEVKWVGAVVLLAKLLQGLFFFPDLFPFVWRKFLWS